MHHVERGPEPEALDAIAAQYTARWIRFYRDRAGRKPRDSAWRKFVGDLSQSFNGLCAYCETRCLGQVDHFRPKSVYPELVYRWSNWMFSCSACNSAKSNKLPPGGYVNPCSKFWFGHPERYFTFDTKTGRIGPRRELKQGSKIKAQNTIDYLRLNDPHHMVNRLEWLGMVSAIAIDPSGTINPNSRTKLAHLASKPSPWSSVVRVWLAERGYPVDQF